MSPSPPPEAIEQFKEFAAPQPTLLTVHVANVTAYCQDTVNLASLATLPTAPLSPTTNMFPLEVVGDIVQINDDPTVKGLYLSKNLVTKSSPTATTPTMISDVTITGYRHDIFKILYPDPNPMATTPMEIGSITAAGASGKPVPPGGPLASDGTPVIGGGDWAITGGTGAFLGVTGQMGGQGSTGSGVIRTASVTEDPSKRRTNALPNNTVTMFLYVIPMMPPQIIEVFHAGPPNHLPRPVTQVDPAKVGDTLILYATGLGPVRDQSGNDVPIGQPFPANATVISPVTVTIGNITPGVFATQSAQGCQGFSNGYVVELILPHFTLGSPETTSIQISSAWIQSAPVTLYLA
jgi:uncharacterized protein (TIGR03437 family)